MTDEAQDNGAAPIEDQPDPATTVDARVKGAVEDYCHALVKSVQIGSTRIDAVNLQANFGIALMRLEAMIATIFSIEGSAGMETAFKERYLQSLSASASMLRAKTIVHAAGRTVPAGRR